MADQEVDILVIGGGLIGACVLLALAQSGFRVLLVDSNTFRNRKEQFDARSLALATASVQILQTLQVWDSIAPMASPIESIHVSEKGRFGSTTLQGDAPLGYIVEMQALQAAILPHIPTEKILAPAQVVAFDQAARTVTIQQGETQSTIKAHVFVAADGADSTMRQLCGLSAEVKSFEQTALVANIGLARGHRQIAYERFSQRGLMAMLPMQNTRSALVWTLPLAQAETFTSMPESDFLQVLQSAFGYRLGRLTKVGQRSLFPLRQVVMSNSTAWPVVFIGNAAHTLHPVAGQGFNLGLRDVAALAQSLIKNGLTPEAFLEYKTMRNQDQKAIQMATQRLVELFSSHFPGLSIARGLGLLAFDNIPLFKRLLSRYASGHAGVMADLVCGIPLHKELL